MKISWWLLLFVIGSVAGWFAFDAGCGVVRYFSLNSCSVAEFMEWRVEEARAHKFAVFAEYEFQADGSKQKGTTQFSKKFANPLTAEEFKRSNESKKQFVWYNPNKIQKATLERSFPLKDCIYAAILLGIFVYFLVLRHYVSRSFS